MDNIKEDDYYLNKVLNDLHFINKHMKNINFESFKENELLLDSMLFRLIQIHENIRRLSMQFKMDHSSIPWFEISGIRNRIVHDYGNVDLEIVYLTLVNDISRIVRLFEEAIV